ncbi:sirohydrochlorin cobaltochelatase [Desulfobacula toluolica]|uniref:CbiK2: sirohydrochlorin cobaltochelatase n=1 Tax=Desulfobacula toluolica (strain DSM 7467 / Tol2) TaxID=651182 RepID=K0NNK6_DESTT|nr:sirohydrochlorin cobaltochelatase [Desulfobacula toluolica]CCK81588.1 CbiK2: sirohydrochlorin cobaltochelatase [Desulfobacula toluolica Tol2]
MTSKKNTNKDVPIILTAFGTTARAFSTYEKMGQVFEATFPEHKIHWAYSSRMVKCTMKRKKQLDLKDPIEMAQIFAEQGHQWVVMQSLHMICGHEFDRLVTERSHANIRSSIGLPLLTSYNDYEKAALALEPMFPKDKDEAVILVGHGTDHPAWTAYPAMEAVLRRHYGNRIFIGVVEYFPDMDDTLQRIKSAGYKKVCLIPLMLVAGVHFKEDLTCEEDSWQKTFERNDIQVSVVDHGIGYIDGITKIFCDHISDALDVIPL